MSVEVASLEEVPLREVWKDEARDFTPWLAQNPRHLGEALHMDLELVGAEVAVGPFSADVVLRDAGTERLVVVENFLETTNHDHLGKLITYASGLGASWAVLVAKSFRPEHRSALNWLNSISDEDKGFFGVEVHAVRIGDSDPAVRLEVVVEPDDFSRQVRAASKGGSVSNTRYREWWAEFLADFHATHPGWSNARTPSSANWMNFPSGRSDVKYAVSFSWPRGASSYRLRAELYLDDGEALLPQFESNREELEARCSLDLEWEHLEDARASRIAAYLEPVDPDDRQNWAHYREWAISAVGELRAIFSETISKLD